MSSLNPAYINCNFCQQSQPKFIFSKNNYAIVECNQCHLVYVGNPPSSAELLKLYSFDNGYHTGLADKTVESAYLSRARQQYRFIRKFVSKGALLDVGCSVGLFLNELRQQGWNDIQGLEFSADTAEVARQRFDLDVTVGTLENTDFEDKKFEVITLWDVIEHVTAPLLNLQKAHAILAENGLLVLETPNIDGLFPKISKLVANTINYWAHPEPPAHLFQFSVASIGRLLNQAGFEIITIEHDTIPLAYSFGSLKTLLTKPKRLIYALAFAALAIVGPYIKAGDTIRLVAKKI